MTVGDIVEYIDDWKPHRQWYLYSISKDDKCRIVLVRNGEITNGKNGEQRFNSNIVNLDINKIKQY